MSLPTGIPWFRVVHLPRTAVEIPEADGLSFGHERRKTQSHKTLSRISMVWCKLSHFGLWADRYSFHGDPCEGESESESLDPESEIGGRGGSKNHGITNRAEVACGNGA